MLHVIDKLLFFQKKISLAVIFLEYNRPEHGGSDKVFSILQSYLGQIKKCKISYLRVDNKNERKGLQKISKNVYSLGGDNRYREFSGWQKGIEHLDKIDNHFNLILFVNDMFLVPGESFLKDYANIQLLKNSLNNKLIIGRIDSTGQKYMAYGHDVSKWICTNCFLVPKMAIDTIQDIVSVKENINDFLNPFYPIDKIYTNKTPPSALNIFKEDAPLNDTYKQWLLEWLTKKWHSKFNIDENSWEPFRAKVRNILNESLLTARFSEAGFKPQVYGDKKYY